MIGHIDPAKETFAAFLAKDRAGPIHMLNLVRFRTRPPLRMGGTRPVPRHMLHMDARASTMWIKRKDSNQNRQPEFSPAKTNQAAQDCNCGSSSECYNRPVDRIKSPAPMRTDHKRRKRVVMVNLP